VAYLHDHLAQRPEPLLVRHFSGGKDDPVERWPADRVRAYQVDALGALVAYLRARSPFYRDKLARAGEGAARLDTPEDLAAYPFTTRVEIARARWAMVAEPRDRLAEVFVSTGTTGAEPLFIAHSYEDLFARDLAPAMPLLVPLRETDIILNALPYEMSSAGLAFHRVFVHGAGAAVVPAGKDGCYGDPTSARRLVDELDVDALITSPSYATRMIEAAPAVGDVAPGRLRRLWLTGEPCSHALRRRLESLWRCPAYLYYGSLECGGIGIECDAQDGFHVAQGHVFVEIIGPDDQPLAPGEIGEIVVTVLLRRAMPLLRYRTGDFGYIEDTPCACGTVLPRLMLRGRRSDQLIVLGKILSPVLVEEMLLRQREVGLWYRIRADQDELLVEAVPQDAACADVAVEERVESRLAYLVGVPARVRFVPQIEVTRGKVRRVFG
jgi:phenylacetate-CoA ligase